MKVTFYQTLGLSDIHDIKKALGVDLKPEDCRQGVTADIPNEVHKHLCGKYKNLFETPEQTAFRLKREADRKAKADTEIRGAAKKPELQGVK